MEMWIGATVLILGLGSGLLLGRWIFLKGRSQSDVQYRDLEHAKVELSARLTALTEQRDSLLAQKEKLEQRTIQLERLTSAFEADKKNLEERIQTHKEELGLLQKQLTAQFENLATRILDTHSAKFSESSEKHLAQLLTPLKDRIQEFQKKVEDTYSNESRERFSLKNEITKIVEANQKMTLETSNLSKALRGDVKAQGNWGELVLRTILGKSGLTEGVEYVEQGKDLQLRDATGKLQQPDVIVNLPEGRHLIIDAKVSLTHYDRFVGESDETRRAEELKGFIESIYSHVSGLAGKRYQDQEKLLTPDFVMMFFPIEGAFSLALQNDPEIFNHAWEKSIVIVSPTTLLATLRTVASIWKQERQQKNALEIAKAGGLLYDKFVGFAESFVAVGNHLKDTQDAYDKVFSQLKTGKGNLISRVENLRKLGAKTSKTLPPSLQEEADATFLPEDPTARLEP